MEVALCFLSFQKPTADYSYFTQSIDFHVHVFELTLSEHDAGLGLGLIYGPSEGSIPHIRQDWWWGRKNLKE